MQIFPNGYNNADFIPSIQTRFFVIKTNCVISGRPLDRYFEAVYVYFRSYDVGSGKTARLPAGLSIDLCTEQFVHTRPRARVENSYVARSRYFSAELRTGCSRPGIENLCRVHTRAPSRGLEHDAVIESNFARPICAEI